MSFNLVFPHVNVALAPGDSTPDGVTQGFSKYNLHEHQRVTPADFRAYSIKIGDPVYVYDDSGLEIYPGTDPPLIDYITGTTIRVNLSTTKALDNAVMYYGFPKGNVNAKIIRGVKVANASQFIVFATPEQPEDFQQLEGDGLSGFLSQKQAVALASYDVPVNITTLSGANTFIPLLAGFSKNCRLVKVSAYAYHGSAIPNQNFKLRLYTADASQDESNMATWLHVGGTLSVPNKDRVSMELNPFSAAIETIYPAAFLANHIQTGYMLGLEGLGNTLSVLINLTLHFVTVIQ